jgi:hypothetical protein
MSVLRTGLGEKELHHLLMMGDYDAKTDTFDYAIMIQAMLGYV